MAILAVMVGCAPRAPQKPSGLAADACWVGTRKTGVFVLIGAKEHEGWRVKAWDDHSGAARVDGVYTLRGLARAELNTQEITAFDGTSFQLADGAWLVPKAKS